MAQGLRAAYDRGYAEVCKDIQRMGEMVARAIENAVESLKQRDLELASRVIREDMQVNELRFDVEEACLALIATQQPAASDLRAVVAAMNIAVDLERMGDHATGIAKTVLRMGNQPLLKPLIDIPRMTVLCRKMIEDSVAAYLDGDSQKALRTAAVDDQIDALYRAVFDELVEIMSRKPDSVERATYLLWCAHNLERIGDRATNIAERVVFMTTGSMKELNIKESEHAPEDGV